MYDVIIIGAGVTGGMLARELTSYKLSVCLLEKENDVACGASKANSGIIHGGYDPIPGTLKAKLNTEGVSLLYEAAKQLNVPFSNNGSLIVSFNEEQDKTLDTLYNRGLENKIENMELISGDKARELEPELSKEVTKALLVNNAGIICPYELTIAAVGNAMDNGADLKLNFRVKEIKKGDFFTVISEDGEAVEGTFVINCAGASADKIAALAGDESFKIIPRAGEYLLLDKEEGKRLRHTVFTVPTKEGKGVLVSPTVDGNLLTGPTASVVALAESNETTAEGLASVKTLSLKSVPSVNFRNAITSFCGVRASEENGDFIIKESDAVKKLILVCAIDSPGLTSCVAIAKEAVKVLKESGLELLRNESFDPNREDMHAFRKLSDEEKNEYIKSHPDYGKTVCRCENVSEGEIKAVLKKNPPANDVDGVKRRTRSGMGRCQGGFCMPTVLRLISEGKNIPITAVTKKGGASLIVEGEI